MERSGITLRQELIFICLAILLTFATAPAVAEHHAQGKHHNFDDAQYWARALEPPERGGWQKPDEVVRALQLKSGQTVVDIGAGTGYFTRRFAVAVGPKGKALGLDIEPSMVEYMRGDAKKRGLDNYQSHIVQPDDPGLKPGSVDLVFLCDAYHHMEHRPAYFRKIAGALKPDGRVVIVDFLKKKLPVGPPPEGKIAREQTISEFRQAGYRLSRSLDFLPYQYFLEFKPAGTNAGSPQ